MSRYLLESLRRTYAAAHAELVERTGGDHHVRRELVCAQMETIENAIEAALRRYDEPDPIPDTRFRVEWEIPVMLYWGWSKGDPGSYDTPRDWPHLEDETVMLGEHDITEMLSPEALADVREAMLRDMEAGE